jgi:flagellar motor component MotA
MDLATVIGFVLAWGVVLFSMWHVSEGAMMAYLKPPELLLVFGGALGAAAMSMPMHTVTGAVNYLKKWLFAKHIHIQHMITGPVSPPGAAVDDRRNRSRNHRAHPEDRN